MRKNFEMTEEDLETLYKACQTGPMIALQCGTPCSAQDNANAAWCTLGRKMGFDGMTAKPDGKGDRFFSAEVVEVKP